MQPRPRIPSNTFDSRASRPLVMERSVRAADPNCVSSRAGNGLHPRRHCRHCRHCCYIIWPGGFSSSREVGGPSGPPWIDWIDVVWWEHCRPHISPSPPLEGGASFAEVAAIGSLSGSKSTKQRIKTTHLSCECRSHNMLPPSKCSRAKVKLSALKPY